MSNTQYLFETLVIYIGFIFLILWLLFFKKDESPLSRKSDLTLIIFLYTIIFGLRYDVGIDYLGYYEYDSIYNYINEKGEPLFLYIIKFARYFKSPCIVFIISAFLQIFFLCLIDNNRIALLSIILVFFLHGDFLSWQNGIRQTICIAIFLYALKSYPQKKHIFYALVAVCYLFHNSSFIILFVPTIFMLKKNICNMRIENKLLIFIISIVLGQNVLFDLSNYLSVLDRIGFEDYHSLYTTQYEANIDKEAVRLGWGYYIETILMIYIILFSKEIINYYKSDYVEIVFSLTFIGMILRNLFLGFQAIGRINYYFVGVMFVYLGYVFKYYLFEKKILLYSSSISMLLIMKFIATIYNLDAFNGYYKFIWQNK